MIKLIYLSHTVLQDRTRGMKFNVRLQMSGDGHYHGPAARQKVHQRQKVHRGQKTRPVIASSAAVDREMLSAQLLNPNRDVLVENIDTSFGSPYRRRPATTTNQPIIARQASSLTGLVRTC